MTEAAFSTTYDCENCGNDWSDMHTAHTRVKRADGDVAVFDTECKVFGMSGCDCCWYVTCPVCGLNDEVSVADRNPIEDTDGEDE
jgi:hypothetical protein